MNDELIDRLAELLEHADEPDEDGGIPPEEELVEIRAVLCRIRTLVGVTEQNPANYSVMLRRALK